MNAEHTFWNAKVTVEISSEEVSRFAEEIGMPMDPVEVADFLNNEVRARGLWNHMMAAGRDYLAASIESRRHRAWWDHSCSPDKKEERYDA
jgi:hypothetical protein